MSRGDRDPQLATVSFPPPPTHPCSGQPFVTLGFYSVYFISNGNTCRETWYPKVPPALVFTKIKRREDPKRRTLGPGAPSHTL